MKNIKLDVCKQTAACNDMFIKIQVINIKCLHV